MDFINFANLSDAEFLQWYSDLYQTVMLSRSDDDYEINLEQFYKLIEAYEFLENLTENGRNGTIKPVELKPKEEHCGVTAEYIVFDVWGIQKERLAKIISYSSVVSADVTRDCKLCISLTIPNVYVKRTEVK